MLDIIIPTYKNKEGLRKTLQSINPSSDITVTIVDDCSDMYYNDIFEEFPFIQIYYMLKNSGPGNARQYGISMTNEPYIMFIDTGDTFIENTIPEILIDVIKNYPNLVIFSWQYKIEEKISKDTNNRLHGRIYKRDFLNKYNIEFCPEASYTNEDIGFNRLCRLIVKDKKLETSTCEEPIINYNKDENSITNKNNKEFFYKQQNKGLALNSIHTIKIAEQNCISENIILEEINAIMASLYYTFLCTIYERPEFNQEAWSGAKLFYDNCFSKYTNNASQLFNFAYNVYIKQIYARAKYWKNFKPLNISKFLKDLKTYSIIPSWYNN